MTVTELLRALASAFYLFDARALEGWAPAFRKLLSAHEGPALRQAYADTLAAFQPGRGKAYPVPSDFSQHLPARHPKLPSEGQKLDLAGHRARRNRLVDEWRTAQGNRAANGNAKVASSLEFIVKPLAHAAASHRNPQTIRLTRAQVREAQRMAISQQRNLEFGPASNGDIWWQQIGIIAERFGIATAFEDWTGKKTVSNPASSIAAE